MARRFYVAWADHDTEFGPAMHVVDEQVIRAEITQEEGGFAMLSLVVRNPRVGLLSPLRKKWIWFSVDVNGDGNDIRPLFFGELVGIPADVFAETVTLEFRARPRNFAERKELAAEALAVLPYYDPVFYDERARLDPDTVLEGYSARWHIDRVTHEVTASDVIDGEDGTLVFTEADALYDSLSMTPMSVPIRRVRVRANIWWTQRGSGAVDLTPVLLARWPHIDGPPGGKAFITTFTGQGLENAWPKYGTNIGGGLSVGASKLEAQYAITTYNRSWELGGKKNTGAAGVRFIGYYTSLPPGTYSRLETIVQSSSGNQTIVTTAPPVSAIPAGDISDPDTYGNRFLDMYAPPGSLNREPIVTSTTYNESRDPNTGKTQSVSRSYGYQQPVLPLYYFRPELWIGVDVARRQFELVTFELNSSMQALVTDTEDRDVLDIELNTVDVAEPEVDDGSDPELVPWVDSRRPIGDARARSYLATDRGRLSLEHAMMVARAHIRAAARAVEIGFVVRDFDIASQVSLRKNATLHDHRLPGGKATGKIVSYVISIDGPSGTLRCGITIGCAIGYGNEITPNVGEPHYVDADYVEDDYQTFHGGLNTVGADLGYVPPEISPNDDGVSFQSELVPSSIMLGLSVDNGPIQQRSAVQSVIESWEPPPGSFTVKQDDGSTSSQYENSEAASLFSTLVKNALKDRRTEINFTFRNLLKEFETTYFVETQNLEIPKQINLEASSEA